METSNSPNPAESTAVETASPTETLQVNDTANPLAAAPEPAKPVSLKDAIMSRKEKGSPDVSITVEDEKSKDPEKPADPAAPVVVDPAAAAAAPKYEPNFKYKAFGKEKEIPETFRSIIKDADSEKQVREVFTRAEAFDDMKGRYENVSNQHQQTLNNFTALDRDVKRVMGFRNKGDLDNFFASIRLSDAEIIHHLQNKASYMGDPAQKQQYQQQVDQRAQMLTQQEQYENLQQSYSTQAVQARAMQLDMVLSRPDVSGVASAWDSKSGEIGSFRDLVIQEATSLSILHKQDISAEQAVNIVLQKFGKLVQQPAPQAPVVAPQAPAPTPEAAPQAPAQPVVVAKPVIPIMNGKGTSPVKQVPKSLDDLKRMGKEAARAEASGL